MKQFLKRLIRFSPVALTKNQHYDRLTQKIIRKVCRPQSNCVDVGCHKGEIMDLMRAAAPNGSHWGFEPIPDMYAALVEKYRGTNCTVSDLALSDAAGTTTFNYVTTNPSYSGLMKREYDRPNEQDTSITVQTARLDEVLPADYRVDLMKIDVEGGEMLVLGGARETLRKWKPVVIFEHGKGASDIYGFGPKDAFGYFSELGYGIFLLEKFLHGKAPMTQAELQRQYDTQRNFYFVASPVN